MLYSEGIRDYLDNLHDVEILDLVREINGQTDYLEELAWYNMDEFNELNNDMRPWEVARACYYGDFCPVHSYWRYDAYGNLESTDFLKFDDADKDAIVEALSMMRGNELPILIKNFCAEFDGEEG